MARTLLIVDDIRSNREILKHILGDEYAVVEAADGREAVAVMTRDFDRLSAVLLDLRMPVMDGFEVLAHMRDSRTLSQLPVIVMTGEADSDTEEQALRLGAKDYISKPYKSAIIKQRIGNTIDLRETAATVNALQRDRLTGLYSREAFFDRVAAMASAHEPGYYIMACFDVDKFKVINDQYGTRKGDEVLRYIARVFREGFGARGGVCCRIAADDFAVFYPASFQSEPELAAMRKRASLINGLASPIAFSIGRYRVDDLSLSPSAMYDRAMMAADSIKGRYDVQIAYYDESLRDRMLQVQEIVTEMESALRERQFEVWYQPQYNHSSGTMVGAEALARWRHPQRGLISPGVFIPVFEKTGFIYALDKYVWEETCRFLRKKLDEGDTPLPVSVNISRYDVFCADVVDVITGLVGKYDIPVNLLRLEITESAFAESTKMIVSVAKQLIDYGFTLEIDDFGSGYSSLNTLKSVPAQVVKLDMRFFDDDNDGSQRSGNIIESVVRMTKWLGMSVIAEGVEQKEQADYLRSIGCNYIQGYLYARPMTEGCYEALCRETGREEKLIALETVENLDSNAFWNPKSMDTLIFNTYVGGACIYEYRQGYIEMLRATQKYAQVVGNAGMTVEDALKLNWAKHLDADSGRRIIADLQQSIATKKEVTGEYVFLDLPGCPRETHLRSTMRVIASVGDRYLVYCMNENITAQRQSEKREREVAEQMRLIMENVNGGICAAVRTGDGGVRIVFANDRFYSMYGYTKEQYEAELSGPFDLIHPDDRPRIRDIVERLVRDKGTTTFEYRCVCRDGAVITVRCDNTVTSFAGVGENVLLSVITDTTELALTRQKERRASEQMQVIMDNVDLGIIAAAVEGDSARYLFTNSRYFRMLGYTKEQFEAEVRSPYQTVAPEDRRRVMEETARINRDGAPMVLEYRALRRDKRLMYVRSAISIGNLAGIDGLVQLSILRDITDEREAERRERRAAEQAQAIMNDADSGITAAVSRDGKVEFLFSNARFYEIHGYTREQYHAEVDDGFALIHPDDRARVLDEMAVAYASKQPTQVEYRVQCRDGAVRWVRVGLSSTRFTGVEQDVHLSIFTDITAQKRAEWEIRDASEQLRAMMDDMPGGFVRMRVEPDGSIRPVYINEGFCKLSGIDHDELMRIYAVDALVGVHPGDVAIVKDVVARMLENGEAHSARYRLLHGERGYIWLSIFGRVSKDAAGGTFLNVYYTDATERIGEEERQKELLDNLPGGAALYAYDGAKIAIVHLNKRYWELVGREPTGEEMSPLSAIHPDDVALTTREIASAVEQKRDISCDIRLRYGYEAAAYRPFHIAGRILPQGTGGYAICAAFTPISNEAMSIQEMLPIALSAMMDRQSDYVFIKDKNLRYVCCSKALAVLAGRSDASEIVGKTDYDFLDAALADAFQNDDRLVLKGETVPDRINRLPSPEGTGRFASTSKFPLKDAQGNIIGVYGIGHDVTETRTMRSQLELLTDSIPGGLATYVCAPGKFSPSNIQITYFNDGYCRLFGFTREEYERQATIDVAGMLFEEDRHILAEQWDALVLSGTPIDCLCRAHVNGGGYKWISHKAVVADRQQDTVVVNAILQDVTDQRELIEQLRISEEESNLAVHLGGNIICRYIVADQSLTLAADIAAAYSLPETISDVPRGPVRSGMISPESADAYTEFFEAIRRGRKTGNVVFQQKYFGQWRWMEAGSSTIFSDDGKPVKAVISLLDVTERLEKEAVYKKWQQSLEDKRPESYSLYRCNMNRGASYDTKEGSLLSFDFDKAGHDFNERARAYASRCVHAEDRDRYADFVNADALLAGYYRGKRSGTLEYRETQPNGDCRWLRLTVDLVEYPNSTEVEAYMMYENIDEAKRDELQTRALAEIDPLTGVLNRAAFAARVQRRIRAAKPGARNALLMLDIDGFKQVNDVFGHGTGDQTLVDLADSLRSMLRRDDLVGRLGGDEFLVFLGDVPDDVAVSNKTMQICAAARKSFSMEVRITASIGIAVTSRDGTDFETLYRKADSALYYVKGSGKDGCAFYRDDMANEHLEPEKDSETPQRKEKKRRMLIVDDSELAYQLLSRIFDDEFIIEKAKDGSSALIRLRHYGNAISVVLLDLIMPGMDGFAVLKKMRESAEMRGIPVIVVSGDETRETSLKAIREGAVDFVNKPVDPDILRIRVQSAISKAENERLRAKNSALEYQESEAAKYKAVLERSGMLVVEQKWPDGAFTYDPAVSSGIAGTFDDRGFWDILRADAVADAETVERMREAVRVVGAEGSKAAEYAVVALKTPAGPLHWFRMSVGKVTDALGHTRGICITFIDLGERLPTRS